MAPLQAHAAGGSYPTTLAGTRHSVGRGSYRATRAAASGTGAGTPGTKRSHDSGKPPSRDSFARKQLKRRSSRRERTDLASREDSRSIRVRRYGKRSNRIGSRSMPWSDAGVVGHWLTRSGSGARYSTCRRCRWRWRLEHRAERKRCPCCGTLNRAEFPEAVAQPVQYGPRLQGIAAYLKNYGLLPYQRTAELFEDLFSIPTVWGRW